MRVIILALILTGCAAAQPSSTDNHHRLPQVECTPVNFDGRFRKMCCEAERCWFAD